MNKMLEGPMVIRSDSRGDGHYLAPRGNRLHAGVDYIVKPGEDILMPFAGKMIREARPYSDGPLAGCVLQNDIYTLKIFYMVPYLHLIHQDKILAGDLIGTAQDVRMKWGSDMTPHIHVEIVSMNVDKLWGL